MRTSKKTSKRPPVGFSENPSEDEVKAAIDDMKPPPKPKVTRYLTAITLTAEQWAILNAMVTIRQRASEVGTRPMTRAEVALACFAKGISEEAMSLPKLPRWSKEDRQLLEKVLGRKLPDSSGI